MSDISPQEWETRYQYVNGKYDKARGIGVDILKLMLQVVITLNIIPFLFHERLLSVFPKDLINWFYLSWAYIVVSIMLGIVAYALIFEGYYHEAHFDCARLLGSDPKSPDKTFKKFNRFFNFSHWFGLGAITSFILGISCIIVPILLKR